MSQSVLTIGDMRRMLQIIGRGHDAKPLAILTTKGVINLDANDIACQGDRILFTAIHKGK
jgi:hypothetical protein